MKYKVGDKVIIREDLEVNGEYDGYAFGQWMSKYKGKNATIIEVVEREDLHHYRIDLDNNKCSWTDEMLEPYKELNKEHFSKEIIEIALDCDAIGVEKITKHPKRCKDLDCCNCLFAQLEYCIDQLKEWANSEYVEPKQPIKLKKFEYDLLFNCKQANSYRDSDSVSEFWIIKGMKEKGYYDGITDFGMTIKQVLENCEVIENV
ncbi:MAG: hypothetical protein ACLUVC_02300 [Longibaculum sp.]